MARNKLVLALAVFSSANAQRLCPEKLRALEKSECPVYNAELADDCKGPRDSSDLGECGGLVWFFSCDDPDLQEGDYCMSSNSECTTDKKYDNCEYKNKNNRDIYVVVKPADPDAKPEPEPEPEPQPDPTPGGDVPKNCPTLEVVEKDDCPTYLEGEADVCRSDAVSNGAKRPADQCPNLVWFFSCDDPGLKKGDFCASNKNECLTSKKLDNCFYKNKNRDIYKVKKEAIEPGPPPGPSPGPAPAPEPGCPTLVALDDREKFGYPSLGCPPTYDEAVLEDCKGPEDCPQFVWYFRCNDPGLKVGDMCKSKENECGTDKGLNNCFYKTKLQDLYVVTEAASGTPQPTTRSTSRPTDAETPRPTMAPGDDDTPRPTEDVPPPDDVYYVSTKIHFKGNGLDDLIGDDQELERSLAEEVGLAAAASEIVKDDADVLQVVFGEDNVLDDAEFDRRRLVTATSTPAVLWLKVRAATMNDEELKETPVDVIANRVKNAVRGSGVQSLGQSLEDENEALADLFWPAATFGRAEDDTREEDGPPEPLPDLTPFPSHEPTQAAPDATGQPTPASGPGPDPVAPTRQPTATPGGSTPRPTEGGGSKKKKKSSDDDEIIAGMDNAGAIVLILFLCLVGCCLLAACAAAAMLAQDGKAPWQGGEKATRGGSFGSYGGETELGSVREPYQDHEDPPAYPEDANEGGYQDDDEEYQKDFTVHTAGEDTYAGGAWPKADDDDDDTYAGMAGAGYADKSSLHTPGDDHDMDCASDASDLGAKFV